MASNMARDVERAVEKFRSIFHTEPQVCVFAPGRVNLIGEHTDYNDGFVFPFALPYRTVMVGSIVYTNSKTCKVVSMNMPENEANIEFCVDSSLNKGLPSWGNYVKGTIFQYLKDLPSECVFNAVITSSIPIGSGLSSSAALEMATAKFLETLYNIKSISGVERALRGQKAEHDFADTPCGIMDQFISSLGQDGQILLIDCRSQAYESVPFGNALNDSVPVLVVTNSNVKHQLSGSEYPDRVYQCKLAVEIINKKYPEVKALRDATLDMLKELEPEMPRSVYRRALHSVTEDIRTRSAVEALKVGNYRELGQLMTQSHVSLKENYEVSCDELDLLVDLALQVPGVFGSRMTGGGFGGCTITLVSKNAAPTLIEFLRTRYKKVVNLDCDCFVTTPSAGCGEIVLPLSPSLQWQKYLYPIGAICAVVVAIAVITWKKSE